MIKEPQGLSKGSGKKLANPYALAKNPVSVNKFTMLYNALERNTKEVWQAKVIDNKLLQKYNLMDYLEYN